MKKTLTIFAVFLFFISCKSEKPKIPKHQKIIIYSIDSGKDAIQAKNKALSFLADQRTGISFSIKDGEINVNFIEEEISFIIGKKIFEKQIDGKTFYACKTSFKIPGIAKSKIMKKKLSVSIEKISGNKKEFIKDILKRFFAGKIKTNYSLKGKIYLTKINGYQNFKANEQLILEITVFIE